MPSRKQEEFITFIGKEGRRTTLYFCTTPIIPSQKWRQVSCQRATIAGRVGHLRQAARVAVGRYRTEKVERAICMFIRDTSWGRPVG